MTLLQNVKIRWTGPVPGDGFSNFYFLGGTSTAAPVASIKVMFEAIKANFPTNLTINYPQSGNVIDDSDGSLQGGWSGSAVTATTGTGPSNYNSASGALILWQGMGVLDGHRPLGKTFLVPFGIGNVGSGVIGSSTVTSITTAAQALVTATTPNFVIWHRPRKTKTKPPVINRVGDHLQITTGTCLPKMCVLTSRRD